MNRLSSCLFWVALACGIIVHNPTASRGRCRFPQPDRGDYVPTMGMDCQVVWRGRCAAMASAILVECEDRHCGLCDQRCPRHARSLFCCARKIAGSDALMAAILSPLSVPQIVKGVASCSSCRRSACNRCWAHRH